MGYMVYCILHLQKMSTAYIFNLITSLAGKMVSYVCVYTRRRRSQMGKKKKGTTLKTVNSFLANVLQIYYVDAIFARVCVQYCVQLANMKETKIRKLFTIISSRKLEQCVIFRSQVLMTIVCRPRKKLILLRVVHIESVFVFCNLCVNKQPTLINIYKNESFRSLNPTM